MTSDTGLVSIAIGVFFKHKIFEKSSDQAEGTNIE